jgi:MFS family permease
VKRYLSFFKENPIWSRVLLFSLSIFFLRIADGIISFWSPNQIQDAFNNPFLMGLIISFQSIVGLVADVFFPTLLKNAKVKALIIWGAIISGLTSILLVGTVFFPIIWLSLIAMAFWGVYYELVGFGQYQFMGSAIPSHMRSSAWGVFDIFFNLAYFIGPLLAALVLSKGYLLTEIVFFAMLLIGLVIFWLSKISDEKNIVSEPVHINPIEELRHWLVLSKVVWPVIIITLILGFVDSAFWTTGAVLTEKLVKTNWIGGLFLPLYQLPSIFLGLVVAKWGIFKGKKILSEKFMLLAGLFLMFLAFSQNIIWMLLMVTASSAMIAICYPLLQAVYSDLVSRMGHESKDMIGLTSSVLNVAYIVWPPIGGLIAMQIGERLMFSYLGFLVILVAIGLLIVTPKKLRLPQEEIKTWER